MLKLTITLDENSIRTEASEAMNIEEVMDVTLSAILGIMNDIKNSAKTKEDEDKVEEFLFNMFNEAASALLAQFAPTRDLRPDITADAIMELENKLIKNQQNNGTN